MKRALKSFHVFLLYGARQLAYGSNNVLLGQPLHPRFRQDSYRERKP